MTSSCELSHFTKQARATYAVNFATAPDRLWNSFESHTYIRPSMRIHGATSGNKDLGAANGSAQSGTGVTGLIPDLLVLRTPLIEGERRIGMTVQRRARGTTGCMRLNRGSGSSSIEHACILAASTSMRRPMNWGRPSEKPSRCD